MKVSLKKNNLAIFKFLAEKNAILEGITDEKQFSERVEELIYVMAEEAFCHSLTPSGEIGKGNNPLTKKLSSELPTSHIVKKFFSGSDKEVRQLEKELHRHMNAIVAIFMRLKIPSKMLKKYSKKKYIKKLDSISMNKQNTREIEVNRYFDFMVSGLLYGWLYEFFEQDVSDYEALLRSGISSMDEEAGGKSNLGKNTTRKAFISTFFNLGRSRQGK